MSYSHQPLWSFVHVWLLAFLSLDEVYDYSQLRSRVNVDCVLYETLSLSLSHLPTHTHTCTHTHTYMLTQAHLNTSFKHFIYFVTEFNLIEKRELTPMQELIDRMLKWWPQQNQCGLCPLLLSLLLKFILCLYLLTIGICNCVFVCCVLITSLYVQTVCVCINLWCTDFWDDFLL